MRRRLPTLALLVAGLLTGSAGAAMLAGGAAVTPIGAVPRADPPLTPARGIARTAGARSVQGHRAGAAPARLVMPRLRTAASVVPESVGPGGALGVPQDPAVLGWWNRGATPGSGSGSVVVDGHVDSARFGVGALAGLRRLDVGDDIDITSASGRVVRYAVAARRSYPKAALPAAVFSQRGPERLVLITCGGHFDRRTAHYSDNVVVWAEPRVTG